MAAAPSSRLDAVLEQQLRLPPDVVVWLEPAVRLVLVVLLGYLAHRLLRAVIRRFEARLIANADLHRETALDARKRIDTLVSLLRQFVNIFLFAVLALVLLTQIGVQVGPLIAGAGIIGVAVGFGAQYLVRDIITGFFMVLENQIRVGDVVTLNGTGGLVEALTLRTIVLRDGSGVVHVFPHGTVNTLANATRDWSACTFNLAVACKEDPDQAMAVIRRVTETLRSDPAFAPKIIADAEIWGIDKLDGSSMTLQGRIRTRPGQQADVNREFLKRIRHSFQQQGIELSAPGPTVQVVLPPADAPKPSP